GADELRARSSARADLVERLNRTGALPPLRREAAPVAVPYDTPAMTDSPALETAADARSSDLLATRYRTHTCGALPLTDANATGAIELRAKTVTILSESKTPPFYVNDPDASIDETLRLRYRYLDIRREAMARRLMLRSRLVQAIREVHHANGFVEVETPHLIKS